MTTQLVSLAALAMSTLAISAIAKSPPEGNRYDRRQDEPGRSTGSLRFRR